MNRPILALSLALIIAACSPSEPIRLGVLAGLSGRVSDLGGPTRNGALLAVEEFNAQGGLDGRRIDVIVRDDQHDVMTARRAVAELIANDVVAIIGPATSAIAVGVVDLVNEAEVMMISGSVTTNELADRDDHFLRVLSPTRDHAAAVADFFDQQTNIRSFTAIYDTTNRSYSESWLSDFTTRFEQNGGVRTAAISFASGDPQQLLAAAEEAVAGGPDMVVLIANSVDAALLAKQIKVLDETIQVATSEWAGTERLIELGGRYVEGAYVPQYFDRDNDDPDYQDFRRRYVERFGQEPGFPGVASYNATNAIIDALRHKADRQSLIDYILAKGRFDGIQGPIHFNQFGDGDTRTYVTQIKGGVFRVESDH